MLREQAQNFNLPQNFINLLTKLVNTGIVINEGKLLYEILYNPTFQISNVSSTIGSSTVTGIIPSVLEISNTIQKRLRMLLDDRLIWSLKRSPFVEITDKVSM
jgi:hypothetical protein